MRNGLLALVLCASMAAGPGGMAHAGTEAYRAAERLAEVMGLDTLIRETAGQILLTQVEANPELARYQEVIGEFLDKSLAWEKVREDILTLYVETFTEAELTELADFYETPAGQKLLRVTPALSAKLNAIGQRQVEANLPELDRMIQEVDAETE